MSKSDYYLKMNFNASVLRAIFALLAIVPFTEAAAQSEKNRYGPRGFFRILNAVGVGSGKLDVSIAGKKVRSEGYHFGDVTGGIPKIPASYKVAFERDGLLSGETKINIVLNETITLIPFGEFVPATDKVEAHWIIRILRLKQSENREQTTATFVNLTRQDEIKVQMQQPDESWNVVYVKRLGLSRAPVLHKDAYVPVKIDAGNLNPISVGTSGNFVAVLYEDEKGKINSRNFQDLKYLSLE